EALRREQKKSQAVRKSKKYIDDILAKSPIPTFILDKNHRVIQWNGACQQMTGVLAEEMLGKEVWEGFSIDDRGSMADIIIDDPDLIEEKYADSIISKQDYGRFELEMFLPKLKGGRRAIITVAPIMDNNEIVRGAIQTIQEIKDLPHENGMRKNGPSGLIEESFVHPTFKIDSRGKISFWNRACEEKFGFPSSQMLGKSPLTFVSKRYRSNFRKMVISVLKGESPIDKEWKYYDSEGKPLYVLANAYPLKASDGEGRECVIVNTNITD
ncbi:unnamed protein product, partial [marine sediment metagenome]